VGWTFFHFRPDPTQTHPGSRLVFGFFQKYGGRVKYRKLDGLSQDLTRLFSTLVATLQ